MSPQTGSKTSLFHLLRKLSLEQSVDAGKKTESVFHVDGVDYPRGVTTGVDELDRVVYAGKAPEEFGDG